MGLRLKNHLWLFDSQIHNCIILSFRILPFSGLAKITCDPRPSSIWTVNHTYISGFYRPWSFFLHAGLGMARNKKGTVSRKARTKPKLTSEKFEAWRSRSCCTWYRFWSDGFFWGGVWKSRPRFCLGDSVKTHPKFGVLMDPSLESKLKPTRPPLRPVIPSVQGLGYVIIFVNSVAGCPSRWCCQKKIIAWISHPLVCCYCTCMSKNEHTNTTEKGARLQVMNMLWVACRDKMEG